MRSGMFAERFFTERLFCGTVCLRNVLLRNVCFAERFFFFCIPVFAERAGCGTFLCCGTGFAERLCAERFVCETGLLWSGLFTECFCCGTGVCGKVFVRNGFYRLGNLAGTEESLDEALRILHEPQETFRSLRKLAVALYRFGKPQEDVRAVGRTRKF